MENKHEELRRRTKQFALRILHLFRSLPKSEEGRIIGRQLLRAGTAVAANYRQWDGHDHEPNFSLRWVWS